MIKGTLNVRMNETHEAWPAHGRIAREGEAGVSDFGWEGQHFARKRKTRWSSKLTSHREVERAELVGRERVGAALQDDGARPVPVHDPLDDLPRSEGAATYRRISYRPCTLLGEQREEKRERESERTGLKTLS